LKKQEYDEAIEDYDEVIRLNPKDAGAYHNRGIAWSMKKDDGKANKDFRVERSLKVIPEVSLFLKSSEYGKIHGTVHNETGQTIEKLKLSIKTAKWERVYDAKVLVENNATATFSVFVGDKLLEVESFKLLSATAR
jgi:tetratricopeptide (TPR) repeat protein